MKKYVFLFEAEVYINSEFVTECGFIPANTFGEAADYLEEYYGDTLDKLHLECSDTGLVVMDKETARKIWENNAY